MLEKLVPNRMGIKSNLRKIIAWGYYYSGLFKIYHKGKIHILMYHRVLKDDDKAILSMQPGMYVTESAFKDQMRFLSRYYRLISLTDLMSLWKNGEYCENENYCVVTFDDGWRDNYLYAYPILKNYAVPATIFLTTSFIGTNRWFWPEKLSYLLLNKYQDLQKLSDCQECIGDEVISTVLSIIYDKHNYEKKEQIDFVIEAIKKYSEQSIENALGIIYELLGVSVPEERAVLNWNEVNEMSNNGVTFGSHTCNHIILTGVPLSEARDELECSMRLLKEKKLNFVPVFCYPNGNYNQEIQDAVRNCGYEAAVTTKFGFEYAKPDDYFGIKRIGVHNDISSTIPLFSFHLSGLRCRF